MNIGIIDADLIAIPKRPTTFPNLACMKISGYHKEKGDDVKLLLSYDNLDDYDQVYISKVYTDTTVPLGNIFFEIPILEKPNVKYGGTGFFFDKAPDLPYEIEHHMPDYTLYYDWVEMKSKEGWKRLKTKYYTDYSIGFMTRGCFRKCEFCVNRKYSKVFRHSPLSEFYDPTKKAISLWDDNILGFSGWKDVFIELMDTGKPFEFKQGLDIRLLTEEKARVIANCKYHGSYIFAYDNIEDKELIERKLSLWRDYVNPKSRNVLYILCGYDKNGVYDEAFWKQDIISTFERIKTLMQYGCIPYIMKYNVCNGPYKLLYGKLSGWCNTVDNYMKKSFREHLIKPGKDETPNFRPVLVDMERRQPEIVKSYFDLKMEDMMLDKGWLGNGSSKKETKLYVLCGFDKENKYDEIFWTQDIINTFERIKTIMEYGCIPFIMRYNKCEGPYKRLYATINDWCNSVPNVVKKSFRELCLYPRKGDGPNYIDVIQDMEKRHSEIVKKYFDMKMEEIVLNKSWR